jgi:hypothetical protein
VHDVEKTLGLFEAMGTAYNLRQLDRRVIQRSFAIPSVQVFTTLWWLICWQREGRLAGEKESGRIESIYTEFEAMCKDLRTANSSLKNDPKLRVNPTVRMLCLPDGHGERLEDDQAWEASRRLSTALASLVRTADENGDSGGVRAIDELTENLTSVDSSQADPVTPEARGWEVVLVPPSMDQTCNQSWARQRKAAKSLSTALSAATNSSSLATVVEKVESRGAYSDPSSS